MFKLDFDRIRSAATMSFLRLTSAGLGFIRNYLITKTFGLGGVSDAYFILNSLATMVGGLMGSLGASVLLPLYNDQVRVNRSPEDTHREQTKVITAFFSYSRLALLIISVFIAWQHDWIAQIFGDEATGENREFLKILIFTSLPLSVLFAGSNAINQILIQRKKFSKLCIPEILSNLLFIVGFVAFVKYLHSSVLIWIFPLCQAVIFFLYWHYLDCPWAFNWKLPMWDKIKGQIPLSVLLWIIGITAPLAENYFLIQLSPGDLSAQRYAGLMVGVIASSTIISYQTPMIPAIMMAGSQRNMRRLKQLIINGIRDGLMISIPIVLLTNFTAPWFIPILFKHGAIDDKACRLIVEILQISMWGLPISSFSGLVGRVFNSLKDRKYSFVSSIVFNLLRIIGIIVCINVWHKLSAVVIFFVGFSYFTALFGTLYFWFVLAKRRYPAMG